MAGRIRDALLEQEAIAVTPASALDEFALEEPLMKSAPTMALLSEFLCRGDHLNKEDCGWYHKAWQYLRLLDLVSTPTWHSAFYLDAMAKASIDNLDREVLISGAADYSMLAYVLHANEHLGAKCNVTLLDMCETPLMISRWYAATKRSHLTTVKQDILQYKPNRKFDLILSDAFLTRFSHLERKKVLRKWRCLLAEDGRIVSTVRLEHSAKTNDARRASNAEVRDFADRARKLSHVWREFVLLEPDEIGNLARVYATRMQSYPVKDRAELQALIRSAGLRVNSYQEVKVKGEMKATNYAEIVASKN